MYRDGQLWLDLYKTALAGAINAPNDGYGAEETAANLARNCALIADAAHDIVQKKRETDGALLKLLEAVQMIGSILHVVDRAPDIANPLRALFAAAGEVEKGRAS